MKRLTYYTKIIACAAAFLFCLRCWNTEISPWAKASNPKGEVRTGQQPCREGKSRPKIRKIGFLKIHKCASSTVQNIFLRYAYSNNLNVALPPNDANYLGNPKPFNPEMLYRTPGPSSSFDMFLLHTRWNHMEVEKVIGEDAFYVTTLRHPVDLFESLYSYGELEMFYNATLEEFIQRLKIGDTSLDYRKRLNGRYGWNQISWDFGLTPSDFVKTESIKKFIKFIEEKFQFVMISERMEESLVLLREMLCWEMEEMTSLKLNARRADSKTYLTREQRNVLGQWLSADMMIYEHFARKFDGLVKEKDNSDNMEDDIKRLRQLNEQLSSGCLISKLNNEGIKDKSKRLYSDKAETYLLRDTAKCRLFALKENDFLNEIRAIQIHREYNISI